MVKFVFLFFLLLFSARLVGQEGCKQILLTGSVEDSLNPQTFYNLMVFNRTKGKGFFGQPTGKFSVYVSQNDSISLSVTGYPVTGFRVHADSTCKFNYHAFIIPNANEIDEVVITPLKTLNQIREERESLAMKETRQVTGYQGLGSPITLLYQTFSKKEQNKRWIEEQKYKDNQRKVVQELLRLYVAYDIINLSDQEFDEFILFLNIDETFLKTASEMELVTFVKDKFEHFKSIHSIQINENNKWRSELDLHNLKGATEELLRLYNFHAIINIAESEFDRFIQYMHLEESFMRSANETELIDFVQTSYAKYVSFYKVNFSKSSVQFNITEYDNYLWRSELACKDNKKAAVQLLIDIYIKHGAIAILSSDMERFTMFLNISESFMKKSTDEEVFIFVTEKYERYLDFYKLR